MSDGAFVGLDVDSNSIQAAVRPTDEQWTTDRDDRGMSETTEKLQGLSPQLVVMEALGGYELSLAGTLATVGLPFAMVSSRSVREFAKVIGRNRSVQPQAGLLAYFAELVRPEARALPAALIQQLKALRSRREQVQEILTIERDRLYEDSAAAQKDLKNHIQFLEKSVISIGEEINRAVRSSCIWR